MGYHCIFLWLESRCGLCVGQASYVAFMFTVVARHAGASQQFWETKRNITFIENQFGWFCLGIIFSLKERNIRFFSFDISVVSNYKCDTTIKNSKIKVFT